MTVTGISGVSCIGLASIGAHGLKKRSNNPKFDTLFRSASFYHMSHTLAMLVVTCLARRPSPVVINIVNTFFLLGNVLFAGGFYMKAIDVNSPRVMPLGGICYIAGWTALAFLL